MSDLPRDLRVKAGMIMMCERIPFGSDATLMEMAANEIEQLQQRNSELESMMVEVNNNRTGVSPCARFCEALATKKMFDNLQRERDELAAQLEQCKFHINCLHETIEHLNQYWNRDCNEQAMRDFCFEAVEITDMALEVTPAQCLAEHDREVAARAVEPAIRSALRTFGNADLSEDEIKKLAFEYSRKVLRGEI